MTTRRGFLGAILAAGMAPMAIKAGVLMPVRQIGSPLLALWGDGFHDDTTALQAFLNGTPVRHVGRGVCERTPAGVLLLQAGTFLIANGPVIVRDDNQMRMIQNCHFKAPKLPGFHSTLQINAR